MARIESTHSDLKVKSVEMKKELVASQEHIKTLTATMKELGMLVIKYTDIFSPCPLKPGH